MHVENIFKACEHHRKNLYFKNYVHQPLKPHEGCGTCINEWLAHIAKFKVREEDA